MWRDIWGTAYIHIVTEVYTENASIVWVPEEFKILINILQNGLKASK